MVIANIIVILIRIFKTDQTMTRNYLFYNIDQVRVCLCVCVCMAIMTAILLTSRHLNFIGFLSVYVLFCVFHFNINGSDIILIGERKKEEKKTLIQEINSEIIEWRSNMNMNFIFEMKVKAIIINQKTTKNQKKKTK